MAFQTGTRVDPRLGALDFSGFTNAANIRAQGMMNLGQAIGGGIEKYQKNKQITTKALAELEGLTVSNPEVYASLKSQGGEVSKSIDALESGNYKQKDALAVTGAMQTAISGIQKEQAVQLKALEEQLLRRELEKEDFEGSVYEVDGVTFAQTSPGQAQVIGGGAVSTPADEADIARTKAQTAQIEAETATIGQPKDLTPTEMLKLYNTQVGEFTFGQYLQELMQTKAIKGGELHQKGIFNFDENQIAAFDNIVRQYPQFLEGMPQAVKDYYGASNITLSDGTNVRMNPM